MGETLGRRTPRFVFLSDGVGASAATARYGWRLVAANYRPLGRGRSAEPSLAACRSAALHLRDSLGAVEASFSCHLGLWTWHVALDGATLAVCVHPYMRRVECVRGLAQFVEAARVARPDEGVIRHFGANALRGYALDAPATSGASGAPSGARIERRSSVRAFGA